MTLRIDDVIAAGDLSVAESATTMMTGQTWPAAAVWVAAWAVWVVWAA